MEINLRPATLVERLYTYNQSSQLEAQTGCIGHLQAEVGFDGSISSTWTDHLVDLKTPEFKADYDQVTHALRFDEGSITIRTSSPTTSDFGKQMGKAKKPPSAPKSHLGS